MPIRCEGCICKTERPACRNCMIRAPCIRDDATPDCCRGCEFLGNGKCEVFGNDAGLRFLPHGLHGRHEGIS